MVIRFFGNEGTGFRDFLKMGEENDVFGEIGEKGRDCGVISFKLCDCYS